MTQTASPDYIPTVEELMPVIGFDERDLKANQQGTLSDRQQARLQRLRNRAIIIGGVLFWVFALVATFFFFMGVQNQSGVLSFLGITITICNVILMGMFGRQYMRLSADLRGDGVETISGQMNRVVRPIGNISNYHLRIDEVDFAVDKDTFKLFRHEQFYHLYRARKSGILLSAEPTS